jgi:hypothetical protein
VTLGKNKPVHICTFEEVELPRGWSRDYEIFRDAVLKAGRFSVFEATENMNRARMFDRLSHDPEVRLVTVGFPWTKVIPV